MFRTHAFCADPYIAPGRRDFTGSGAQTWWVRCMSG